MTAFVIPEKTCKILLNSKFTIFGITCVFVRDHFTHYE